MLHFIMLNALLLRLTAKMLRLIIKADVIALLF